MDPSTLRPYKSVLFSLVPNLLFFDKLAHVWVSDLVTQGHVQAFLHERGWRPRITEVMTIATYLAEAVAAVHAAGLVHRDIKPGNVLLSEQGGCVLSDFGLADTAEAVKEAHVTGPTGGFHKQRTVGTLQYLPPEVLMSRPHTQVLPLPTMTLITSFSSSEQRLQLWASMGFRLRT